MEIRVTFGEGRSSSGGGSVVGQRKVHFVTGVSNPLVELRGCWKNTPVRIRLCNTEDIVVVLGKNEGTKQINLGMGRRFGESH